MIALPRVPNVHCYSVSRDNHLGAFGQVWKATKLHGGTDCVVRMLPNDFVPINTPVGAEQFKNECEFLQLLRHTNLVGLLGGGVTNDRNPFVVSLIVKPDL